MVQSTYPHTVPEELYNLTQLADVTLAAGKLSTTNIQKIKAYIHREDNQIVPPNDCTESKPDLLNSQFGKFHPSNCVKSEQHNVYDRIHKTTNIEMRDEINPHSVIKSTINCEISVSFQSSEFHHRMSESSQHLLTAAAKKLTALSASSEDDSIYHNYSHKIFDKRRTRKLSFQSDDSSLDLYNRRNSFHAATYFGVGNRENDDSMMSNSETDSTDFVDACKTTDANGDDVHVCPECSKKYSTSSNLARHRQTHR